MLAAIGPAAFVLFLAGPEPSPPKVALPETAAALEERAAALEKKSELAEAVAVFREALAERKRASEPLAAAADLQRLASIELRQGDLDASERDWKDCLELRHRLAPRTREEAAAWNGLGAIAYLRGDLDGADEWYGKALAIDEVAAPESVEAARTIGNLGIVAFYRGDLDRAEIFDRRALAMQEKIDPGGTESAGPLNYLGVLAKSRGDYDSAEQYYARALAIFEKRSPGSVAVAGMENNLGVLCKERGDLEGAWRHQQAALELRRRLAPGGLDVAASLNNLAEIALSRNDPDTALPFIRESLEIKEKVAPQSLNVATSLVNFAEYHLQKRDPGAALSDARRALEIRRQFEPGSLEEAETFAVVARAEAAGGERGKAAEDYRNALAAVEAQRRRIGGAEAERAAFSTRSIGYYRETAALLHELHRDEEAFGVIERSRARELLALSGQRDLRVDAGTPAGLLKERSRLDVSYDRVQQQIGRIDPVRRMQEADRLVTQLHDLREQRAAVQEKIWSSSPRFRELEDPHTLTVAEARRALDPGTAVLSYSIGEKQTLLFAIPPESSSRFEVWSLPVGADDIAREVEVFRNLIRQERGDASTGKAREEAGRRLYRALIAPASGVIARSRRVLICPDGPLHLLPFAALSVDGPGRPRYLAEWKPLHIALSVSLAVERARHRTANPPALQIAAFGDPAPAQERSGRAERTEPPASLPVAERAW
ncbi:MAG: tetratricopeptide repeat protein, partial [Thermoanaerobaculia bacterium]